VAPLLCGWYQGQPFPEIKIDGSCYTLKNGAPPLQLADIEGDILLLDLTDADLAPIDNTPYDSVYWSSLEDISDYILLQTEFVSNECSSLASSALGTNYKPGKTIFGKLENGQYVVYDPRLVLKENTAENPLPDGGGASAIETNGQMECSNAPRSFLNEDYCRLSTDTTACSEKVPVVTTIELTSDNLQAIIDVEPEFDHNSTHLYAFVDIPITNETFTATDGDEDYYLGRPPCYEWHWSKSVRFQRRDNSDECNSSPGQTVDPATAAVFAKYLKPEFDDPMNPDPFYKTIKRRRTTRCAESDEDKFDLGYILGEDGTCWKHVHELEGNVYGKEIASYERMIQRPNAHESYFPFTDMTYWYTSLSQDTNWVDISSWKRDPEVNVLSLAERTDFGQWVSGNQWMYEAVDNEDSLYAQFPGHLYDIVPFDDLPDNLQVQGLEDKYGQSRSNGRGTGVVVCGSIGEVANEPERGEGFQYAWDDFRDDLDTGYDIDEQVHTIWAYLALNAPDQLRQRMAWALSQVNVVGFGQIDDDNNEAILQYYDIFVRHAFGSYKDIMKKVSFSDAMARFLSSRRNKSFQYSQSEGIEAFPDENYAREILQLFTVGLVRLNMDGSVVIGSDGQPVESYSNIDLISYSRAWTGLETPDRRANNDGWTGRVDPMIVSCLCFSAYLCFAVYSFFRGLSYL
jgi:hypothetical protein